MFFFLSSQDVSLVVADHRRIGQDATLLSMHASVAVSRHPQLIPSFGTFVPTRCLPSPSFGPPLAWPGLAGLGLLLASGETTSTSAAGQALPHVMNDAWRLTFINNANACLLFVPFVVYFEGSMLLEVSGHSAILVVR